MSTYAGSSKNLEEMYERKHGLSTEPVPVSAYVGSSKNLKDLKDQQRHLYPSSLTNPLRSLDIITHFSPSAQRLPRAKFVTFPQEKLLYFIINLNSMIGTSSREKIVDTSRLVEHVLEPTLKPKNVPSHPSTPNPKNQASPETSNSKNELLNPGDLSLQTS